MKVAAPVVAGLLGPVTIVVTGAAVSTIHAYVAGEPSTLPALSIARTAKVWVPSARPV